MAGQVWTIEIVPVSGGISLNPKVFGAQPGTPLKAELNDLVFWSNLSGEKRTIDVAAIGDLPAETLTADAWKSTTAYHIRTPSGSISPPFQLVYTCSTANGNQRGIIEVVA